MLHVGDRHRERHRVRQAAVADLHHHSINIVGIGIQRVFEVGCRGEAQGAAGCVDGEQRRIGAAREAVAQHGAGVGIGGADGDHRGAPFRRRQRQRRSPGGAGDDGCVVDQRQAERCGRGVEVDASRSRAAVIAHLEVQRGVRPAGRPRCRQEDQLACVELRHRHLGGCAQQQPGPVQRALAGQLHQHRGEAVVLVVCVAEAKVRARQHQAGTGGQRKAVVGA